MTFPSDLTIIAAPTGGQGFFPERVYAEALTGGRISPLLVDAYKASMAQAGFPLRKETFVLAFRKGGPYFIPFDFNAVVQALIPDSPTVEETDFLNQHGYGFTPAMLAALKQGVEVKAAPKGSWVLDGEPILTITGPSFLASWFEDLCLMFRFPCQIATAIEREREGRYPSPVFATTCHDDRRIIQAVARSLGCPLPQITHDDEAYRNSVRERVRDIAKAIDAGPGQAFEVGLRAATCILQHSIALKICKDEGITQTSHLFGALIHDMKPVGSTGHEHQQRWAIVGKGDAAGFRAIRDMHPEPPSYLFDAIDAIRLGIPEAIEVMRENPNAPAAVRYDSGDQDVQLRMFVEAQDIHPTHIFEDGYTADKTRVNEVLCNQLGIPPKMRRYGYGGFIVSFGLTRDMASAAYKLSMSGGEPTHKFSDTGKRSIPGNPVILRRTVLEDATYKPCSLIAQEGEEIPGYAPIDPTDARQIFVGSSGWMFKTGYSPQTKYLINQCRDRLGSSR